MGLKTSDDGTIHGRGGGYAIHVGPPIGPNNLGIRTGARLWSVRLGGGWVSIWRGDLGGYLVPHYIREKAPHLNAGAVEEVASAADYFRAAYLDMMGGAP